MRSLTASALCFLVYMLLYSAPIVLQFDSYSQGFIKAWNVVGGVDSLVRAGIIACAAVGALGAIVFSGWRRLTWVMFLFVAGLALVRSETARQYWSIWQDNYNTIIFRNYLIQMSLLALLPVQLLLWRHRQPVIHWCRNSLALVAILQTCAVLVQYWIYRHHGAAQLIKLQLAPRVLMLRDSNQLYTDAPRLTGLVSTANLLGMVLLCTWPALLPLGKALTGKWKRRGVELVQPLLIAMAVLALLLCYSRAAYLGLMVQGACLLLVLAFSPKHRHRRFVLSCAFFFAAIAIGLCILPRTGSRIGAVTDMKDASLTNRLYVYKTALMLLAERPLSGWGPGFFNTLYNRFYKLVTDKWSFFGVHSSILNSLMELGIAGVLLGFVAVCGLRPLQLLRRLPAFAWLCVVPMPIVLLSDSTVANPAFLFPFLWIAGVWLCTSWEIPAQKPARGLACYMPHLAVGAVCMLWIANYALPMRNPYERFLHELERAWRGPTGTLNYHIKDLVTGSTWGKQPDSAASAGSLAKLAVAQAAVDMSQANNDTFTSTPLQLCAQDTDGPGFAHRLPTPVSSLPLGNAFYLMLSASDNTSANALLRFVGNSRVASTALRCTGTPIRMVSGFNELTTKTRVLRRVQAAVQSGMRCRFDTTTAAMITPRQATTLLVRLCETSSTLNNLAADAFLCVQRNAGLTRYLQSSGKAYNFCALNEQQKNEALIYQNFCERWAACIMRKDDIPRLGSEQPTFVSMGIMGWRIHLFLMNELEI